MNHLVHNGGEGQKVGEHREPLIFELEAYPEPKALDRVALSKLLSRFKTTTAVAEFLGASQAMVWERLNPYRKWEPRKGRFKT